MLNNVDLNKNFFDDKIKHNIILLYSQFFFAHFSLRYILYNTFSIERTEQQLLLYNQSASAGREYAS